MKDIKDYKLTENPFQHLTPSMDNSDGNIPWAGHEKLKEQINEVYLRIFKNSPRQVVLNWGQYGGGKTYAAHYFTNKSKKGLYQAYIRSPKKGGKADEEFYKNIINYISYRKIKKQINLLLKKMGDDEFFDFLQKRLHNEEIVEALIKIGSEDPEVTSLMHRYIFDGLSKAELKKVELAKNLDFGTESIKFLAGIILCFIGDQKTYEGRFVLWVDEMEDMIYYSQKEYRAFSQVLRDLIDSINQNFAIFFNFTLAESEEETIELLLGAALWSRINKKIRFKELNEEEALKYCLDLIKHYQIGNQSAYFPFQEDILLNIIKIIPSDNLTPREINRYCGEVLQYAMEKEYSSITTQVVNEALSKIHED